jgi:uncharacterized membrane protein YkoI
MTHDPQRKEELGPVRDSKPAQRPEQAPDLRKLTYGPGFDHEPEFIRPSPPVYPPWLLLPLAAAAGRARETGRLSRFHRLNIGEIPMSARCRGLLSAAVAAVFVLAGSIARADDKEKEVPKKVMDALKAKFPKAVIDKWTKEKEGDAIVYDIEFKEEGRKCEADIKEDGTIVNYEREIAVKDLPKAVTEAVEKKYPKATLKEVMEITEIKGKEEKLEGYEINLVTADKKEVEVTIAPDGKVLEDSSEKKEKKDK